MKKEIVTILERRFPASAIKKRPGSFGKSLSYVGVSDVIVRANEAFGSDWSFEVISTQIVEGSVIAHTRVSVEIDGKKITKDGVGGKKIFKGQEVDCFKASVSDSLKKAMVLFGVALDLYGPDTKDAEDDDESDVPSIPKEDGPISEVQERAITKMAGSKLESILAENKVKSLKELKESQAKAIILGLNSKGK